MLEEATMHVVISGGAGFLGSHLTETLLRRGDRVTVLDDLSTGRVENLAAVGDDPLFRFVEVDVTDEIPEFDAVDAVAHLASAASPPDYHRLPLETLAVGSRGTETMLELAGRHGARFVLASTSEIYGDPHVHPQREDYWGNVNPIGRRSVYDEAKRFAEALTSAYGRTRGTDVGIVRIFNTYGPRMRAADGRVVTSFIAQPLNGDPITIYGDGSQTRSFCFVEDLVRGLVAMLDSDESGPVNLGNPNERTVLDLAKLVSELVGTDTKIRHFALPEDDPTRRRPDISRAQELFGWNPDVDVVEGLRRTIEWFVGRPGEVEEAAAGLRGGQVGVARTTRCPARRHPCWPWRAERTEDDANHRDRNRIPWRRACGRDGRARA